MPYKRRFTRRPRRGRRQSAATRYMGYAQKALRVAQFVKSVVNVEYKFIDVSAGVSCSSTGAVALLTGIAVGTTQITRNGNSILTKSLYSQVLLTAAAGATTATMVRYILFRDKQDSSSVPGVTEVLQSASVIAPLNRNNGDRFMILCDKRITVPTVGNDTSSKVMKCYKKLHFHTKFLGDTAAQSDVGENHIYVLCVSDQASNNPAVNHQVRIKFIDN